MPVDDRGARYPLIAHYCEDVIVCVVGGWTTVAGVKSRNTHERLSCIGGAVAVRESSGDRAA